MSQGCEPATTISGWKGSFDAPHLGGQGGSLAEGLARLAVEGAHQAAIRGQHGVEDGFQADLFGDPLHFGAHGVFDLAQVRAAGARAEQVGGAGGGGAGDAGLDDFGPARKTRDVVRDDAAHAQQEIRLQGQPADLHGGAVGGGAQVDHLGGVLPGVVEHFHPAGDLFAEALADFSGGHRAVGAQGDQHGDLPVGHAGLVELVQQDGQDGLLGGGAGQVVDQDDDLTRPAAHRQNGREVAGELAQGRGADGFGKRPADLSWSCRLVGSETAPSAERLPRLHPKGSGQGAGSPAGANRARRR